MLGAPWDSSGSGRGEQQAPAALRAAGLSALVDLDLGDAATTITGTHRDEATGVRALPATVAAARALAGALDAARREHPTRRPLILGGDCSLLLGVFASRPRLGLWLLDGHPDHADGRLSETGETADMELAILTGEGPPILGGPLLPPGRVALIGHRTAGLDAASAAELARVPPEMFTAPAAEVRRDPGAVGRRAAQWAAGLGVPMWLHLDLDVLDPVALPAVTYPQDGGPDFGRLAEALRPLGRSPALAGVSVADLRPDLDPDGGGARRVVELIADSLSLSRSPWTLAGPPRWSGPMREKQMDLGLTGRTVIVTGATGGLGEPIARRFAAEGADVVLTYHEAADAAGKLAADLGGRTLVARYALGDADSARELVDAVLAWSGRVDVLVNNAVRWGTGSGGFEEVPDAEWLRVLRDNTEGALALSRLVVPHMRERRWGRLVHISSSIATEGMAGGEYYGAAKAALHGFSRSAAFSLGRSGDLLSNVVSPGLTRTRTNGHIVASVPESYLDVVPLGRFLDADEVAAPVVFLASAANTGITGQVIAVDAGVTG